MRAENPDASLSADVSGSGVGVQRAETGHAGFVDNVVRQHAANEAVPIANRVYRSKYYPGHSGGRSSPDGDIGHS